MNQISESETLLGDSPKHDMEATTIALRVEASLFTSNCPSLFYRPPPLSFSSIYPFFRIIPLFIIAIGILMSVLWLKKTNPRKRMNYSTIYFTQQFINIGLCVFAGVFIAWAGCSLRSSSNRRSSMRNC